MRAIVGKGHGRTVLSRATGVEIPWIIRTGLVLRFQRLTQVGGDPDRQVRVCRLVDVDTKAIDLSAFAVRRRRRAAASNAKISTPRAESAVRRNSLDAQTAALSGCHAPRGSRGAEFRSFETPRVVASGNSIFHN